MGVPRITASKVIKMALFTNLLSWIIKFSGDLIYTL